MGKTKIFRKPRTSTLNSRKVKRKAKTRTISPQPRKGITELNPEEKLVDIRLIGTAIMECLIDNDPDGVMEVIETYLEALNKSRFLQEAGVPRSTMYQLFKRKNPTVQTLAKIVHAAHQASDEE